LIDSFSLVNDLSNSVSSLNFWNPSEEAITAATAGFVLRAVSCPVRFELLPLPEA